MAGFNNDAPRNSIHQPSSWGRTRQAKNLRGDNALQTTTSTIDPSAITDGYATEGQKHLHLFLKEGDDDATTITVYGLTYAFGGSGADWYIVRHSNANLTIAAQNATNVMSGEEKIDISGIDRLFFKVTTGTITANDEFYAAVNTLPTI